MREDKGVEHQICLSDLQPSHERSCHIPLAKMGEVRHHLQELIDHKIITESKSPYASPIIIMQKKNGNLRMCIDYRSLNARIIVDQYTVLQVQEALDCLVGSKWFSVLDLHSGYYHIHL